MSNKLSTVHESLNLKTGTLRPDELTRRLGVKSKVLIRRLKIFLEGWFLY